MAKEFQIIGPEEKDLSWEILHQVEELQKRIWGFKDLGPCYPARLYKVEAKIGGTPLIAVKDGKVIGFLLGFAAYDKEGPYIWSQIMGVAPEWQGKGIGKALKLKQREVAIKRNIKRIEWTFDPLEAVNAVFNLSTLGAKGIAYERDIYGEADGPMYALPSDRLRVRWNISEKRAPLISHVFPENAPKALDAQYKDGVYIPKKPDLSLSDKLIIVRIPKNIRELILKEEKPGNIAPEEKYPISWKWRESLRKVLEFYIDKGWIVSGANIQEERAWLVLLKEEKQ